VKRLDVILSDDLAADLDAIAAEAGVERHDVVRRGLAVLLAFREARARGIGHIGFTSDPARLDVEIVNVL
jgi:predicted transcriptional regulator